MLSGYAKRPTWDVAGVDYYVGVPNGTTLQDPTTATLPAGAAYSASSHTVTVSGSNVTLNGFDFSLHNQTALVISGANVTIENSYFMPGSELYKHFDKPAHGHHAHDQYKSSASNVSLLNSEVNGNSVATVAQQRHNISISNTGTIKIEYNHLHNSGRRYDRLRQRQLD